MKTVAITTSPQTPRGLVRVLECVPGAQVRAGSALTLTPPGGKAVEFMALGPDDLDQTTGKVRLMPKATRLLAGRRPIVFAGRMSSHLRQQLGEAGISHADGSGRALFIAEGLYIALEGPTRTIKPATPNVLGHVGLRAAQVLVDHRADVWSTAEFAVRAGVSLGQAHKVLHALEKQQLVEATGTRNNRERKVVDRGDLLDWIGTHRLIREPTDAVVLGYAPARDSENIFKYLAMRAKGPPFAITGLAAATAYGHPVTTTIPVTTIRVAAKAGDAFTDAVGSLDIELVDRAPNVRIIRDTGDVGTFDRRYISGVPLAPPSRVYLDMLTEGRGEDAADLFRATALKLAT